jgi:hypothetical protein
MREHRSHRIAAACTAAIVVAVAAGVSATASGGATRASAIPNKAERGTAQRLLTVTMHARGVGYAPRPATPGRTMLVVRNARAETESFVLAHHVGGVQSLPRFEGVPYVPPGEVVASLHGIRAGGQQRVAVTLASGSYLLVATPSASGSMIFADAVTSFRVR